MMTRFRNFYNVKKAKVMGTFTKLLGNIVKLTVPCSENFAVCELVLQLYINKVTVTVTVCYMGTLTYSNLYALFL